MADAERDTEVGPPRTDPSPETFEPPAATSATAARGSLTPSTEPTPGSDTLMSVPTSASKEDLALDQRLAAVERRLDEMETRIGSVESRRRELGPKSERQWVFWLIFLAALAIAWQILALFR
jgi:hypothetical protein